MAISFIVAVNNTKIFLENAFVSSDLKENNENEVILKRNFPSVGIAYNEAIAEAKNDLMVFMHQDIYLPDSWVKNLYKIIKFLESKHKRWGILGCYGISKDGFEVGHVYCNGLGRVLGYTQSPQLVQSLDEIILVFRKRSGLLFDAKLPYFHFYGTDICLEAEKKGLLNYAIGNFCVHNTVKIPHFPREFWRCVKYMRKKWKEKLPIKTTCITLYSQEWYMFFKRIISQSRMYKSNFREKINIRLPDPRIVNLKK